MTLLLLLPAEATMSAPRATALSMTVWLVAEKVGPPHEQEMISAPFVAAQVGQFRCTAGTLPAKFLPGSCK